MAEYEFHKYHIVWIEYSAQLLNVVAILIFYMYER
jgi:hypothetical protein